MNQVLSGQSVLLVSQSGWPLPSFKFGVEALGGKIDRFLLSYSMSRPDWSDFGKSHALKNQELRDHVGRLSPKPHWAIFVTYDDSLEIETLKFFKKLGIRTICYHVDMVNQWYRVLKTGRYFDLVACAQLAHRCERIVQTGFCKDFDA